MFSSAHKKKKVFVGLSGGVDSAVSVLLLKKQGYDVTGVFIRIAIEGYPCPAAEDRLEAMRVAAHLHIPFVEIDLSREYQERVFTFAVEEFERGRTPNPDALCNKEIKFGIFYDFARKNGADFVATGHYARVVHGEETLLLVGVDDTKDQSYFLWAVPHEHLSHALFPVGGLQKSEVRNIAKRHNLPNAARHDSQGLCFLGDIAIDDMLSRELAPTPGDVLSEAGEVVGTHRGAALYTLGQRHGFEFKNTTHEARPHFVIAKDLVKNTITVSANRFPINVSSTKLVLDAENWIGTVESGAYMARFRYRQALIPATLIKNANGESVVVLKEAHYVPEGQSVVLYCDDRCVGGGIIKSVALCA